MIHLYIGNVKQETFLREKMAIEETEKFSEFMLTREIQMAGFCGCNKIDHLNINYPMRRYYFPIIPIQIFSKNNHPFGKKFYPESDILVLESMSNKTTNILKFTKKSIKVDMQDHLEAGEPLIFSDCKNADIFIPNEIQHRNNNQTIKITAKLHYDDNASIGKFVANAFFIEKTHRKNIKGNPIYALYSYDLVRHKKTECFSGIEEIKFFYATFDGNESSPLFKPLLHGDNLSKIRLIKISLAFAQGDPLQRSTEILHQRREFIVAMREII